MRTLLGLLALACVFTITLAQEEYQIVPEALVEEMTTEEPRTVSITRECFEKSCMEGDGHKECRMTKMPCAAQREVPWSVFLDPGTQQQKLLATDQPATGGLVGLTVHKAPVDPNHAVEMPGVPMQAPPKLLAQLKKQDKLLNHIAKLEAAMIKKHGTEHTRSRKSWLKLEENVVKMPAGPDKLKSEKLLLKLAKEMSQEEKAADAKKQVDKSNNPAAIVKKVEGATDDVSSQPEAIVKSATDTSSDKDAAAATVIKNIPGGRAMVKKVLVAKMRAAAQAQEATDKGNPQAMARDHLAEEMAPKFVKAMMAKIAPKAGGSEKPSETIDGIPVAHRKCFERACISKDADGTCAAAVISCGDAQGHMPKETNKLSKKEALKAAKNDMGPMLKGLKGIAHGSSTLEQLQQVIHQGEVQAEAAGSFLGRLSGEAGV